jgi:hypothetical protein
MPVERMGDGRFALRLDPGARRVIASLVDELRRATADGPDLADPAFARLYPPARPDDPAASAAFAELVRDDLVEGRRAAIESVEATVNATSLDTGQAAAWLGVCNDLRLVLGTRLGIEDEAADDDLDEDGPEAWAVTVFHFLGWLVAAFVDALAAGLPDEASGRGPAA